VKERQYEWFIEPLDGNTNTTISRVLPEENFFQGVECRDGRKRNLWGCAGDFVSMMRMSKTSLGLRFRIFNRCDNGKIRECRFFSRKKRRK